MTRTPDLKILFDGACPLCRREVGMMRRKDKAGRLAFDDIAAPGFDAAAYGLTNDAVNRRIHGVLGDGTIVEGMEVFRRAYRALGMGWLVGWTAWPILRPIADLGYRLFARNRHWLTGRRDCTTRCAGPTSAV